MDKGIGGHQRAYKGRTDDWLTPPEIIKALGPFDLDPCCPPNMPWETAARMISLPEDGLSAEWSGRVFLNSPYGPETGRWLEKLATHGFGTALVFARTETEMFHRHVWERASACLFLEGRLHFHDVSGKRAPHNAGGPSVLVAYGQVDAALLSKSGLKGKLIRL